MLFLNFHMTSFDKASRVFFLSVWNISLSQLNSVCCLHIFFFFPNVENKSCHSNLITVLPMQSRLQGNLILCVAPRCNSVSAKA